MFRLQSGIPHPNNPRCRRRSGGQRQARFPPRRRADCRDGQRHGCGADAPNPGSSVGGVVTSQELQRMPVNGRNYTRLIMLMPGSSDQGGSQSMGTISGTQLISINGQRRQDNNYTVDGVDNNFMMMNSPGASPPMDSIQEFKVANNTSAEFGRSMGANVNMVVKSGTRDLHGSMYEYFRNNVLDANDFFANRQGSGKVPFRQNQYGLSFGGPVYIPKLYTGRDKTFWFVNWEGYRRRRGTTAISTSPIEDQRNAGFSQQSRPIFDPLTSIARPDGTIVRTQFPGNRIPANRISPSIKLLLDSYVPLPNRPGLSNNLVNTESLAADRDAINFRVDHTFNAKENVFFRYLRQHAGQASPNANPVFYSEERFDANNLAAAWYHIFGATTVLKVKFGYNFPSNPSMNLGRSLSRADYLTKAGISMYSIERYLGYRTTKLQCQWRVQRGRWRHGHERSHLSGNCQPGFGQGLTFDQIRCEL